MATDNGKNERAANIARWRAAGLSEAEIETLLRVDAPPPPSQAAGNFAGQQMPMSGALGNLNAAVGYAKGVIPAVQKEIATAASKDASATRRLTAFAALALIAAVVVVIGYGVSLELSILRSQATKAAMDACVARYSAFMSSKQTSESAAVIDAQLAVDCAGNLPADVLARLQAQKQTDIEESRDEHKNDPCPEGTKKWLSHCLMK